MKKFICSALLIIGCAPECGAMHTMKNVIKKCLFKNNRKKFQSYPHLPLDVALGTAFITFVGFNGGMSFCSGIDDGLENGIMQSNKVNDARCISIALAITPVFICPFFFATNIAIQVATYGLGYRIGKSIEKKSSKHN